MLDLLSLPNDEFLRTFVNFDLLTEGKLSL